MTDLRASQKLAACTSPPDLSTLVKAYDIRGRAHEELTEEVVRALGAAFADLLDAGALIVSHDMRVSSPAFARAFAEGAVRRGSTVAFSGLSSTDQLYCASGLYKAAGAQITASHNPADDNGIKLCFSGARPVTHETGLSDIRDAAQVYLSTGDIPERTGGRIEQVDTLDDYISLMAKLVPIPEERPLRVVVDAANAMAGHTVPALAQRLEPVQVIPLYFELDGTFPYHDANPLNYATLEDLQSAVRENEADLGLAFDGDADRVVVVDERGTIVSPSAITSLIAVHEIQRAQAEGEECPAVVANVVSSRAVREAIEAAGGRYIRSRVGHSHIKTLMAQENAVFGGEHSAHYYFRDFFGADSGMLAALHVLRALAESADPLSMLVAQCAPYYSSGEINSRVDSVEKASAAVKAHLEAYLSLSVEHYDGYTFTHWNTKLKTDECWWVSLRPSNTEPLLRLNVEAASEETMAHIRDEVVGVLQNNATASAEAENSDHHARAEKHVLPEWVLSIMQCPVCRGSLRIDMQEAVCLECSAHYAVHDSIPVLIPER